MISSQVPIAKPPPADGAFAEGLQPPPGSSQLEADLLYWSHELRGPRPILELPVNHPRQTLAPVTIAVESFQWPLEWVRTIETAGQEHRASLFTMLLSGFYVLLHRYSGQEDIIIGCPVATHPAGGVERPGAAAHAVALRLSISSDQTVAHVLDQVNRTLGLGLVHRSLPLGMALDAVNSSRERSPAPLFQVMLSLQGSPQGTIKAAALEAWQNPQCVGDAVLDLLLVMDRTPAGLAGKLRYRQDLFEPPAIRRMLGHFRTLLEAMAKDARQRIGYLPMLTPAETKQILHDWNDTARPYPREQCVHQLFEAQVRDHPDAVAIIRGDQQFSYRQINTWSNRLAHRLRAQGVATDTLVGLCMDRSVEMIVGMLGAMKAGGAYVPLDPGYPRERLNFMIEDAQPAILVTRATFAQRFAGPSTKTIVIDNTLAQMGQSSPEDQDLNVPVNSEQLAHVLYTSGSTGRPKGVMIPHRGVARLVFGNDYVRFDRTRTFLQLAPVSFDVSTLEIWGALLHGAKCVIYPNAAPTLEELGSIVRKHGVTSLCLTAALFNAVIDQSAQTLATVQEIMIGGEAPSVTHVRRALEALPDTKIVNCYGPTENSCNTTTYCVPRDLSGSILSLPIGLPIGNTRLFVLDRQLQPVPIGVPGELHIGGDGLARGYLHCEQVTADTFIPNPFAHDERLYRSGDLVRYLPDGQIEFLGRRDHQVKIRGCRIELGEIETVLLRHRQIRLAAVLARNEALTNTKQLVAYLVPADPQDAPQVEVLRDHLRQTLPEYMVPAAFVAIDSMPLTPNGKVDRRALSCLAIQPIAKSRPYAAPRNHTEVILAELFEALLNQQQVGVTDDFFDLGGHSLLAIRLVAAIADRLGTRLPVAALMQHRTVEQLARLIRGEMPATRKGNVLRLRNGTRPPFFYFHGDLEGGGLYCDTMVRGMHSDQTFYCVHSLGPNQELAGKRVQDMARVYTRQIREAQPTGPYYLGGFCNGAILAYEVARQLREQGQQIALLVAIGAAINQMQIKNFHRMVTKVGDMLGVSLGTQTLVSAFVQRWVDRWRFAARGDMAARIRFVQEARDKFKEAIRSALRRAPSSEIEQSRLRARADYDIAFQHLLGIMRYLPRPCRQRIVVLQPRDEPPESRVDPTDGWAAVTPHLEMGWIPGTHDSCYRKHAEELGRQVQMLLDDARAQIEGNAESALPHSLNGQHRPERAGSIGHGPRRAHRHRPPVPRSRKTHR